MFEILTVSDVIQIFGIIASLATSVVAIYISMKALKQNAVVLEETMKGNISIYGESINTSTPMFFIVIKNSGASQVIIRNFDFDFDFSKSYKYSVNRDVLRTDLVNCAIAPGQSRICCLEYKTITRPITFTVKYESLGKEYNDSMTIDLRAGVNMPSGKSATSHEELKSISYTFQEYLQKHL